MKTRLARLSLLALAAVMFLFAPGHAQQDSALAQDTQRTPKFHRKGVRAVPNQYIVVLDQDATGHGRRSRKVRAAGHCGAATDRPHR